MQLFAILLPKMFAASCTSSDWLFGFPTWYEYLGKDMNTTCQVVNFTFPNDFLLIGLAIIDILLRLAGIFATVYVLYGGFQYLTSQGEPDKLNTARSTITNALVGLAIALIASALVAFIGHQLG
jgi:hypothetical protein